MTQATPARRPQRGIPTMSGLEHVGLSVPNLEQAIDFFCNVIGCELLYRHGPYIDDNEGAENFYTHYVGMHARTKADIAMLRCGNGSNLELFEFDAPDQRKDKPYFAHYGSAHLTFYVSDMDKAVAYLREHNVDIMGGVAISPGPEAGEASTNTHFRTPWGQMCEVISYPHGRDYERETDLRLFVPDRPETFYSYT